MELYMIALAFVIYTSVLIAIGLYSYRQTHNASDFLVGGRHVGYVVTALSAHASDMSSWLFFGFPAAVYLNGIGECWAAIGLLCGMWATWHFVAPRLRKKTEESKSVTLSHFFAHASGDKRGLVSKVSAGASLFFFLFYIASGLKGVGTLLFAVFGLPQLIGVFLAVFVVVTYTTMGGYLAVAMTDAFQAVFLLFMIILVPVVTFLNLPAAAPALTTPHWTLMPTLSYATVLQAFTTALAWGIGYCGMPHVLTKFIGIDSVKNVKKAQYVGLAWQTIALCAAASIGLVARYYFVTPPANTEHIFIILVTKLFSPLAAGFILCAILAATISTLDSQVIVSATIITKDVAHASPRTQVWFMRISILLLSLCAAGIALCSEQSLYEIVRYAWSGLGSTFGPLVIASLYFPRLTPAGALAGMGGGALTAAVWPSFASVLVDAPMIPGFFIGALLLVTTSYMSKKVSV